MPDPDRELLRRVARKVTTPPKIVAEAGAAVEHFERAHRAKGGVTVNLTRRAEHLATLRRLLDMLERGVVVYSSEKQVRCIAERKTCGLLYAEPDESLHATLPHMLLPLPDDGDET